MTGQFSINQSLGSVITIRPSHASPRGQLRTWVVVYPAVLVSVSDTPCGVISTPAQPEDEFRSSHTSSLDPFWSCLLSASFPLWLPGMHFHALWQESRGSSFPTLLLTAHDRVWMEPSAHCQFLTCFHPQGTAGSTSWPASGAESTQL